MSDHLGESAALYALGMLEPHEQSAAEEHLGGCDACRRLLAQAQADVTAMAASQTQYDPPVRRLRRAPQVPRAWLALAAAVVVALLPAGYLLEQNLVMHQAMLSETQAMIRVATSPHRTVAFNGTDARVMYAPDGSWYCIVIRNASAPLHVMWPHDGTQTMLGTAVPHGGVALLYLPVSHRMDQLALTANGQVVGQAQLVF
ncbi:MAG TPA: zf-HC2 domain-containing protein [Candidatus Acidoferrales bacterium]|nr:zf-HC2 domain-containing protein [Candidatus Acidoferrales bacterium]